MFFKYGDNDFYRSNHFTMEWSPLLPLLPNRSLVILVIVKLKRDKRIDGDILWAGSVSYRACPFPAPTHPPTQRGVSFHHSPL